VRRHGHPWRLAAHSQSLVAVAESGNSDRGKLSLPRVCLTPTLDEKAHVDEMIAKMHRRTAIARPFLSDPSIPLAIRTSALRMCIIQPATWGAEWCGIKHPNASRLQTAANMAMRLVVVV